jgi:hypothetical protein
LPKADSIASHFKNLLFPKPGVTERLPYNVAAISFEEIDVGEVFGHFDLEEKAKSSGTHDLPSSDSEVLDGNESLIVQYVEGRVGTIKTGFANSIAGIEDLIHNGRIADIQRQLTGLPDQARNELKKASERDEPENRVAIKAYHSSKSDLSSFRHSNGINRPSKYPLNHKYQRAQLLFAAMMEGIVNMWFFKDGLTMGWLGGFGTAFALAAFDVWVIWIFARGVPWLVSGKRWMRVFGGGATIVTLLWLVYYNLYAAHVREAVEITQDFDLARNLAFGALFHNPFSLQHAESWALFVLGLIFTSMAVYAVYNWDDPIPFYGTKTRAFENARIELEIIDEERRADYYDVKVEFFKKIETIYADASQAIQSIAVSIKTKERIAEMMDQCIEHHKQTGNALIAMYRSENQKWRSTPSPKRFNEWYSFDISDIPITTIDADKRYLLKQQRLQKAMQLERDQVHKDLENVFENQNELLKSLILGVDAYD